MSDDITTSDIEQFADKLEAFSETLSEKEQAMLGDMVGRAANIDADEVAGFSKFGIREMTIGLNFGDFRVRGVGGKGMIRGARTLGANWVN
ncbi:MAG: hypothetical protein ACE367_18645 [Acidimicrobiales bacterium]